MNTLTRRSAVVGALTSTAAVAMPATAGATNPDQQIVDAYQEWSAAYDALAVAPDLGPKDDASVSPWLEAMFSAERKMMAVTPVTARGLAIQFLVFTSFGEFEATKDRDHDFAGTVERLAEIVRPQTHQPAPELT